MATMMGRLAGKAQESAPLVVTHRLGGRAWIVDGEAAGEVMGWVRREPAAWRADIEEMSTHFPHWVLVGGRGSEAGRCSCGGPLAPLDGALRCVLCGKVGGAEGLMWVGQLPVLARPDATFTARRKALRKAGFTETEVGGLVYHLVPLAVIYPTEWPSVEPGVYYTAKWLSALGLPLANGSYHLVSGGRACLFGWNQWRAMSVAAVLQQRVVNHVVSLLKIAAGMAPHEAFIGRVTH